MRLLNTRTLKLENFLGTIPSYAILSHTWEEEEVLYADILQDTAESKKGYAKIVGCCKKAVEQGFDYAWIDTCCIDKTSSAELSEAINSMYEWYQKSTVCYAYFQDVTIHMPDHNSSGLWIAEFLKSRWFTRGWTLQELIAPKIVEFYTREWNEIGTKDSLASRLSQGTNIPARILRGKNPLACSVAERMSWASNRKTTREEDMAYCLLGLFNINMPLLYGEGVKSFIRLQEQILKQEEDYSILSWTLQQDPGKSLTGILASSPSEYAMFVPQDLHPPTLERDIPRVEKSSDVDYYGRFLGTEYIKSHTFSTQFGLSDITYDVLFRKDYHRLIRQDQSCPTHLAPTRPPEITSRGLSINLPLLRSKETNGPTIAWLYCEMDNKLVCIGLAPIQNTTSSLHRYGRHSSPWLITLPKTALSRFVLEELLIHSHGPIENDLRPNAGPSEPPLGRLRVVTPEMSDYATYVVAAYPPNRWSLDEFFFHGEPSIIGIAIFECAYRDETSRFCVLCGIRNGRPWCSLTEVPGSTDYDKMLDLENLWRNVSINEDVQFPESSDRVVDGSGRIPGAIFTAAVRIRPSQEMRGAAFSLHAGAYRFTDRPSWVDIYLAGL